MVQFIIRKIGAGLVVLFAISFLTYFLLYFSSSNIARNILGEYASQEQVAAKEAELGLDQPLIARFLDWAGHAITGDFGRSWFSGEPVATAEARGHRWFTDAELGPLLETERVFPLNQPMLRNFLCQQPPQLC